MPPTNSGRAADGPSRGFFDAWSRVYDFPVVQLLTYRPVHDAVLEVLAADAHHRVLDIGCGTGRLVDRIVAADAAGRVVGCDFSAGMLGQAAARLRLGTTRAIFVRGDAMRLPFGEGVFDVVISTEAFHWFPDQDAALREFLRVLVPAGRLLLALVNPPVAIVSELFRIGSRLAGQPLYWPTTRQLRRQVEAAGFEVLRQRRIYRVPGFLLPPALTVARRPA